MHKICQFTIVILLCAVAVHSEDKPDQPRIAFAIPFAIRPNTAPKVILRGWKLNRDIEAKSTVAGVTLKVIRHDTAPIPNGQDAKQIGDTLVELEVTLPEGISAETLPITLFAGGVESLPYSLLVGGRHPVIAEVEPNDGFRHAQVLAVPQIVDGQIHTDRNVDIYAVELATEQRLLVEVIGRRQGSALDSLLTIFDAKGRKVIVNDDAEGTDSKIDIMLAAGKYFLVLQDAHDRGGAAHPYRLIVQN